MINTYTYLYDGRKNSRREQVHLNDCHFNLVYRTVINGDVAYGTAGNRSTILIDINQAQGVHTVDSGPIVYNTVQPPLFRRDSLHFCLKYRIPINGGSKWEKSPLLILF